MSMDFCPIYVRSNDAGDSSDSSATCNRFDSAEKFGNIATLGSSDRIELIQLNITREGYLPYCVLVAYCK